MIVGFLHSDKPRERLLAEAVVMGCNIHGDKAWAAPINPSVDQMLSHSADVYCMVGVKSRLLFHAALRTGAHVVLFDKGYLRHQAKRGPRGWEYWRVSLNAHSPTYYLRREWRPSARFDAWEKEFRPWRKKGGHIVIAGSSAKYHEFNEVRHPTLYNTKVVKTIRELTDRKIVYRPKPSWKDAEPIYGTRYSGPDEALPDVLNGAWCLVTHGSNAALDAIMLGIPAIVLGEGVAAPISSRRLNDIESPRLADDDERRGWFNNVAHWQWTQGEIASGEMWGEMRMRIIGGAIA